MDAALRVVLAHPLPVLARPLRALLDRATLSPDHQDLALAAFGALDEGDLDFWVSRVVRDARPAVLQAGLRALARRNMEAAFTLVDEVCQKASDPSVFGPAIAALLPSLYETWHAQHPDLPPRAFLDHVERLPPGLGPAVRAFADRLRQRLDLVPKRDLTSALSVAGRGLGWHAPSEPWGTPPGPGASPPA